MELEDAFYNYINAKADADRASAKLAEREEVLLKLMEQDQRKTMALESEGRKITATYTQRYTTEVDEKGLRKAMRAKAFDKYVIKKLDRKALERAMEVGEVDPRLVAQYAKQVQGKTFLTYRVKDTDEAVTDR